MKMISSTSITSTIGVTLMSELTFALRFALLMPWNSVSCLRVLWPGLAAVTKRKSRAPVVKPAPLQQLMFCSPLFYNAGSGPRSREGPNRGL